MNRADNERDAMLDQGAAVKRLVAEHLRLDESAIDPAAHFVRDLGVDSLDLIELITELEAAFGIVVGDPSRLATLDDVVAYVRQAKVTAGSAGAAGDR
jgi:acyl carrier protein